MTFPSLSAHLWAQPLLWSRHEIQMWARWTLMTVLGFGAGLVLAASLPTAFAGVLFGACLGAAQWQAMRPARWTPVWIAATALGAGSAALPIDFILAWAASSPVQAGLSPGAIYLSMGVCLGVAQWWVLRRSVARAEWWIVANLVGFSAGAVVLGIGSDWLGAEVWFNWLLALLLAGSVSGLTGAALVWLLRNPQNGARLPSSI
jgi:hypothetical protein